MKIYLAGKVHGDKWKLFNERQIKSMPIVASDGGKHSEHTFGWGAYDWAYCAEEYRDSIKRLFVDQIKGCSHVIAYLHTTDSYGSIAEIAYASAIGKPCTIFLVTNDWFYAVEKHGESKIGDGMFDAYWFVCSLPNVTLQLCCDLEDAKVKAQMLLEDLGYKEFSYNDYLKSDGWRILKRKALQRAEFRCQLCGKDGEEMHVHHRRYDNLQTDEEIKDLIVLCRTCHETYHGK